MSVQTTAAHRDQVLAAHPDVRVQLLSDRAPWHRGEPIREVLAAKPSLDIVQRSAPAPDLHSQEYMRNATRKAVSHNHTDHACS